MSTYQHDPIDRGSLLSVPGLRGATERAGLKPSGAPDLALVVADQVMNAAGVFTTNTMAAAPVVVTRERLRERSELRSVVINSGNANALTGPQGHGDAKAMLTTLEACCGGPGAVLSTGIIGVPLPIRAIVDGIERASTNLRPDAGEAVAGAILTTDLCTKTTAVRVGLERGPVTVGGTAKGSGMIHPNLATMLAIVATDAPIADDDLAAILGRAVDQSFHEITVDGDCSTNDTVLLLARKPTASESLSPRELDAVADAIQTVSATLARKIVEDGEGKSRLLEIVVSGADSDADARAVAQAIATSPLVKTALAGGDPMWGRFAAAIGNAGVPVRPEQVTLRLAGHTVFECGVPVTAEFRELARKFSAPEVTAEVVIGSGAHQARMVTTDLTKAYVEINANYSS